MIGEESLHVDDLVAFKQEHFVVLQQAAIVSPYIDMHKEEILWKNPGRSEAWQAKQHRLTFGDWLHQKLMGVDTGCRELDLLAIGPSVGGECLREG